MDNRYMNTYHYPSTLVEKYPNLCFYNRLHKMYISEVNESFVYNRYTFLNNTLKLHPLFKYGEFFCNDDGIWCPLPEFVIKQIADAITSIDICPNHITMRVKDDRHYVLSVEYTNEGVPDKQPKTNIKLEYCFAKDSTVFSGYFSSNLWSEERMPLYEIVKAGQNESFLRVHYNYHEEDSANSTLDVKVQVDRCKSVEKIKLPRSVPREFKDTAIHKSLLAAVFARVFPIRDFYTKFSIDTLVKTAREQFRDHMKTTALRWHQNPVNIEFSNFMMYHHHQVYGIEHQPDESGTLSNERVLKAMRLLITKFPFFTTDNTSEENVNDKCIFDIWMSVFGKELTAESVNKMRLSRGTIRNLAKHYPTDTTKYADLVEMFPDVRNLVAENDLNSRLEQLKKTMESRTSLSPKDVASFNRMKSSLPIKWRYYLKRATESAMTDEGNPLFAYEKGDEIIKRKRVVSATNLIEEINYLDVELDVNLVPLSELMQRIEETGHATSGDFGPLHPKTLEARFADHQFSQNYKQEPTEDDLLAVRFSNVYKKSEYRKPSVPEDFYQRFETIKVSELDELVYVRCPECRKRKITNFFTECKHLCICEFCSLFTLNCNKCSIESNSTKVEFC